MYFNEDMYEKFVPLISIKDRNNSSQSEDDRIKRLLIWSHTFTVSPKDGNTDEGSSMDIADRIQPYGNIKIQGTYKMEFNDDQQFWKTIG